MPCSIYLMAPLLALSTLVQAAPFSHSSINQAQEADLTTRDADALLEVPQQFNLQACEAQCPKDGSENAYLCLRGCLNEAAFQILPIGRTGSGWTRRSEAPGQEVAITRRDSDLVTDLSFWSCQRPCYNLPSPLRYECLLACFNMPVSLQNSRRSLDGPSSIQARDAIAQENPMNLLLCKEPCYRLPNALIQNCVFECVSDPSTFFQKYEYNLENPSAVETRDTAIAPSNPTNKMTCSNRCSHLAAPFFTACVYACVTTPDPSLQNDSDDLNNPSALETRDPAIAPSIPMNMVTCQDPCSRMPHAAVASCIYLCTHNPDAFLHNYLDNPSAVETRDTATDTKISAS